MLLKENQGKAGWEIDGEKKLDSTGRKNNPLRNAKP
jgi:hypothetical protein